MKLFLHNILTSRVLKAVKVGYPLALKIGEEQIPSLPSTIPADYEGNQIFLKLAHRALLEVDILEGTLVCPETGHEFPISNGIPNMLVNEGE